MSSKLVSLLVMAMMLCLAWLCSMNRKIFPWRTVLWGLGLQLFFALFILKTPIGAGIFDLAQRAVLKLNDVAVQDRKSTRLNSSHEWISYAVFCLKKKKLR